MPTPPINQAERDRRRKLIEQCLSEGYAPINMSGGKGSAVSEAARRMGLIRSVLDHGIRMGQYVPDWKKYVPPKERAATHKLITPEQALKLLDPDAEAARRIRALEEDLRLAQRETKQLRARADKAEALRTEVFALKEGEQPPVKWTVAAPRVTKATVLLPTVFTSDFQCGEVIKADELDGMNEYNMNVFSQRYQLMIERVIDLCEHHVGKAEFPGVYYLRGGDAISGEIHDELRKTNDLAAVPALRWLFRHERDGIRKLRAKFGRVHVISIPGNHGRTTVKPESKNQVATNFETLLSWWLESAFDDDPNVTFVTPISGDAYFKCAGWNVLMAHGDRMGSRGGMGFVGPAATIARGHRKLYDNFTRSGKPVDYILTGHLHSSLKLTLGFANGALCGYSEFARDLRADVDEAKQWLLLFHEKRGVTVHYEMQLSEKPKRTEDHGATWRAK